MKVTFLKAGNGDSILLQHRTHNILIDGGNNAEYVWQQVNLIFDRGEVLDLLIITHHDDDHIRGIIDVLKKIEDNHQKKRAADLIKLVIFNSPGQLPIVRNDNLLSYRQAFEVEVLLKNLGIKCEGRTNTSGTLEFGDLKISFLSPTENDRQEYVDNQGGYLASDYRCDWEVPIPKLEEFVNDDSQDISLTNRSCIVVLCECEGEKILLSGDITPKRLEEIINQLKGDLNQEVLKLDYMTLPHHGSYRNLNKSIVKNLNCSQFIISTNGAKYYFPNKRALIKVLKHLNRPPNKKVNFLFNYQEALANLNISEEEKRKYNFSTSANTAEYGLVIGEI